jgi:hypothetical protein
MSAELRQLLDASSAPEAVKLQAITTGLQLAGQIALASTQGQAGGQFFQLLLELFKLLLPLLLELLKPKV